jgi:hypothetical protein
MLHSRAVRGLLRACLLLLTLLIAPRPALAWGDEGHKVIALIAEHYLDPAVRAKMATLLSADTDLLTAHDIASEATWADKRPARRETGLPRRPTGRARSDAVHSRCNASAGDRAVPRRLRAVHRSTAHRGCGDERGKTAEAATRNKDCCRSAPSRKQIPQRHTRRGNRQSHRARYRRSRANCKARPQEISTAYKRP